MNVNVQSIKFDADRKLIEFIERKVSKLERFFEGIVGADVYLRVENHPIENKKVEIRLRVPMHDVFAERVSKTFEESVDSCIDAIKPQLTKVKEKLRS